MRQKDLQLMRFRVLHKITTRGCETIMDTASWVAKEIDKKEVSQGIWRRGHLGLACGCVCALLLSSVEIKYCVS